MVMVRLSNKDIDAYEFVEYTIYQHEQATELLSIIQAKGYDPGIFALLQTGGYDYAFTHASYKRDIKQVGAQMEAERIIMTAFKRKHQSVKNKIEKMH